MMRIVLVSMPWNLLETPSLPLGILGAVVKECANEHEVHEVYGNLAWADYLVEATGNAVTTGDYDYVANIGAWHGMGDWIFTPALYDSPGWRREEYTAYLDQRGIDAGKSFEMAGHSAAFVSRLAARIAALEPDLIGFSSTFQQNIPSLATARELKRLLPATPIVFGGGNCDAPMGPALHRNFPFVDYVISGEAEHAFVEFVDHLDRLRPAAEVSGLSWRAEDGSTVTNKPGGMIQMESVPSPDYTRWFQNLEATGIGTEVKPRLLYEAARGCWWGEKHTCTFCGLNGLTMKFRSRPPEQVLEHLRELVSRHKVLDIVSVDNILDTAYLKSLLPALAGEDWDLHFYYEVKSNLRESDVRALRRAGLVQVQPGIENLSSRVLQDMDKGVHSTQNVRLLRDCADNDVTVDWNYLYGFPGESEADYEPVLEQLPALAHLQPPGGSTRILLERYSPYFERPELGFGFRQPASLYQHVYDLPRSELDDLVYQFDTVERGIGAECGQRLRQAIKIWQAAYPASSLSSAPTADGGLVITDDRVGWPRREIRLAPGTAAAGYETLRTPHTVAAAARSVGLSEHEFGRLVDGWVEQGLVFREGGRVVALATRTVKLGRG